MAIADFRFRFSLLLLDTPQMTDSPMNLSSLPAIRAIGGDGGRDRALIHILSHGLRAGEVVNLNLAAFDGRILFLADTKTDEPRLVPLRRESGVIVERHLEERRQSGENLSPERPLILSL